MTDERLDTCVACLAQHAPQFADCPNANVAECSTLTVLAHALKNSLSLADLRDQLCKTHRSALIVGLRSVPDDVPDDGEVLQ